MQRDWLILIVVNSTKGKTKRLASIRGHMTHYKNREPEIPFVPSLTHGVIFFSRCQMSTQLINIPENRLISLILLKKNGLPLKQEQRFHFYYLILKNFKIPRRLLKKWSKYRDICRSRNSLGFHYVFCT